MRCVHLRTLTARSELASDTVRELLGTRGPVLSPGKLLWCATGRGPVGLRSSIARARFIPLIDIPDVRTDAVSDNRLVPDTDTPRRPLALAIFLIVAGALGWWAAFALTVDKFLLLENPQADLDCNFSLIVQCGANLSSPQGAVFGFPNPLLGLGGFVAPIAVGVGLLAGARFDRWFWSLFNLGLAGALAFVIWLISQSLYVLGTLCPWCMLVWSVTIPLFWIVTARNAASGVFGAALVPLGRVLRAWAIPLTIVSYAIVLLLIQLQLDIITHLAVGSL